MYQFICKIKEGNIVPLLNQQQRRFNKLISHYELKNVTVKVTIEISENNVNEAQQSLYRAYILEASKYFGYTYSEMEEELKRFFPKDSNENIKENVSEWKNSEIQQFIIDSNTVLAEHGFKFD